MVCCESGPFDSILGRAYLPGKVGGGLDTPAPRSGWVPPVRMIRIRRYVRLRTVSV